MSVPEAERSGGEEKGALELEDTPSVVALVDVTVAGAGCTASF